MPEDCKGLGGGANLALGGGAKLALALPKQGKLALDLGKILSSTLAKVALLQRELAQPTASDQAAGGNCD